MAGIHKEIWLNGIIENWRKNTDWINYVPLRQEAVAGNVMNMALAGADPDVLIDNTVYPIASSQQQDTNVPVALRKLETTNTIVTKDELHAISYDKIASTVSRHQTQLREKAGMLGAYAIAPAANTGQNLILRTTGNTSQGTNLKAFTSADLIRMEEEANNLNMPQEGRILLLHHRHRADLLRETLSWLNPLLSAKPNEEFYLLSFKCMVCTYTPYYDNAGTGKIPFAALPITTGATPHRPSSVLFHTSRVVRGEGTMNMYYQYAETNPKMRQNEVGFDYYHIITPTKNEGFISSISG